MASITEILQLCRLCLVKEQVNVPIFEEQGDIRQIFLKITACLPVKISREDKLPKKICNGCLYKLELLYQFWNTSTNAEKQLLSWLSAAGMDANTQTTQDAMAVVTQTQVVLKQEPETTENVTVVSDPGNFILQAATQPIEFPAVDFDYQENFSTAEQELANNSINVAVEDTSESEPVAKRPRRAATATVTAPLIESDDDEDDPGEAAVAAKTEEDSDDDTNMEPTFVDVAEDQDGEQPGPSGLGKIVEPPVYIDTEHWPLFSCNYCFEKFKAKDDFDLHMQTHSITVAYFCTECPRHFKTQNDLVEHLEKHRTTSEDKIEHCRMCIRTFKLKSELELHMYTHCIAYPCNGCDKSFSKIRFLTGHIQKKHPNSEIPDKHLLIKYYKCNKCDVPGFDEVNQLKEHVESTHTDAWFECKECGKIFAKDYRLQDHQWRHHPKPKRQRRTIPYQCEFCPKAYRHKHNYTNHVKYHHLKQSLLVCSFCGANHFRDQFRLKEHITNVHLNMEYKCEKCPRVLKNATSFKHHIKRHEDTYVPTIYKCSVCDKNFKARSSYKCHMQEHDGNREFIMCEICGKLVASNKTLTYHMRTHTREKPYCCEVCGKSFSMPSTFKEHYKVHTNERPYECEVCKKKFRQQSGLIVHRRVHTGVKPYNCKICGIGYTRRFRLEKHVESHNAPPKPSKKLPCEICKKLYDRNYIDHHLKLHKDKKIKAF